jgi:predicted nuclease of predicted toxin-antitoxin system
LKPLAFPLLADENIHPDVIKGLAAQGTNIRSVAIEGLSGADDLEVLRHAHATGRVVVTHDSDFGTLAVRDGVPFIGIIHVRPGHIVPGHTIATLAAIATIDLDVKVPFIIVAERRDGNVRVRLRQL